MGRGYSAEQWVDWISEHAGSGLMISAFCDSVGVSENSFYVWRRKLQARENECMTGSTASLVELTVVDGSRGSRYSETCAEIVEWIRFYNFDRKCPPSDT